MWTNAQGEFERYQSRFRQWVRADGSTRFAPEAGRYHLYVSLACPWAHRTLIVRALRRLENVISVSVVDPVWNDQGWHFSDYPGATRDFVNHAPDLISIYRMAAPGYDEEETTPVLWDKRERTLVNNESAEIIRMLDHEFRAFGDPSVDLCPPDLEPQVDQTIRELYEPVNNGVYRAGFATSQKAYESAVKELFAALDRWESVLAESRYLCGNRLTEADVCLFTTLLRFEPVYYSHFKCNLRRLQDYPNLWGYLKDLYQTDGVAGTVDFDHIKRHYYASQLFINPSGVVPLGPPIDLNGPHGRERLARA